MWRDDEPAVLPLQRRDVVEGADVGAGSGEVDEQDMVPPDVLFDAAKEHDAPLPRVVRMGRRVEVAVVQRDGQGAVAERGGPIDELTGRVRDAIGRVLVGMRVELELDHRASVAARGRSRW